MRNLSNFLYFLLMLKQKNNLLKLKTEKKIDDFYGKNTNDILNKKFTNK